MPPGLPAVGPPVAGPLAVLEVPLPVGWAGVVGGSAGFVVGLSGVGCVGVGFGDSPPGERLGLCEGRSGGDGGRGAGSPPVGDPDGEELPEGPGVPGVAPPGPELRPG
ncbi:hypothetical protein AB0K89_30345, partial [Streptomyces cinnamoneus]